MVIANSLSASNQRIFIWIREKKNSNEISISDIIIFHLSIEHPLKGYRKLTKYHWIKNQNHLIISNFWELTVLSCKIFYLHLTDDCQRKYLLRIDISRADMGWLNERYFQILDEFGKQNPESRDWLRRKPNESTSIVYVNKCIVNR